MTSKKMVLGGILAFFMSMLLVFSVGLLTGNLFDRSGKEEQSIALTEGDWWINDGVRGTGFDGGDGSPEHPYEIRTAKQLAYLSYLVYSGTTDSQYSQYISGGYYFTGAYFKQTADIDLSAHYWQPIGIEYDRNGTQTQHYFSGIYDGGGYTISGVKTPYRETNAYLYQGLFGYVSGESSTNQAEIKNVGVINSNIQGNQYVGGIAGYASNTMITNCYNTGSVTGYDSVGGIVAYAYYATISNSYNKASVTGTSNNAGGIAGLAEYSFSYIINCYNEGSVSGGYSTGGITGMYGVVNNCYNAGEIIGKSNVGGISGVGDTISNCYNTGRIESNIEPEENLSVPVGGICGAGTKIFNCYNEGEIIGVNANVGGICGTIYEIIFNCYNIGSVTGSDSVGGIVGDDQSYASNAIVSNCFNLGKVNATKSDAMYVGGISGESVNLANSYFGGACDLQGADQSLESNAKTQEWYQSNMLTWDFELIWTFNGSENGYPILNLSESPIGSWINPQYIDTNWEGAGTKQNPYLISTAEELAGLSYMIYSDEGSVANNYYYSGIYFKQTADIDLSAHYWTPIGGQVYIDRTTYIRYFSGNYDGGGFAITGIYTLSIFEYSGLFGCVQPAFGTAASSSIINVNIEKSIILGSENGRTGAIAGYSGGVISNCYNTGIVIGLGGHYTGAITGYDGNIINCYNTGKVIGAEAVGGISGSYATVINSFNVGLVQRIDGSLTSVGGIAGENATITNSFYGGDCMLEGYTENLEVLAKDQTWFENFLPSWSFDFIWKFVEGENNGYPVLNNEKLKLDSWLAKTTYYNTTWQGQGTQTDPYLITCAEDLAGLSYMVYNGNSFSGRYFKQTANIDLSAHQWQPIGVEKMDGQYVYRSFYGRYDGGGFTISGLFVLSNDSAQGLFGFVSATISNVGLINSYVQGDDHVGGISGQGGTIRNCFNSSTIIGNNYVGGITGNGSVSNCYNTGSVTGFNNYVGGIVGQTYSNDLNNCYNVGTISGTNYVGGISGYGNPINSFNLGKIQKSDSSANFGGITGSGTATNCYFGGDCNLDGSDPLLEENAKTQEWYDTKMTSWDFSFVWGFESQGSLPILNGGDNWIMEGNYSTTNWLGSGSKEDPFQIWTAEDLARLSYLVYYGKAEDKYINGNYYFSGVYFKQKADIDLSAHAWQPIGIYCDRNNDPLYHYFSGSYDGGNFTISGISTPSGTTNAYSYQGLFGYVYGQNSTNKAEIKNVGVINSNIQGYEYVGGIVGNASSNSIITNCYFAGNVFGSSYVGGITGYGSVSYSYNEGNVEGVNYVGGIAGDGRTITNSYNSGEVKGTGNYTGGLTGRGDVHMFSYNKGAIIGTSYVGGISGQVESIAINTYNVGSVTATGTNVGGVAGSGNAMYSYYGGECGKIGAIAGSDIDGVSYLSNLSSIAKTIEWYQNESNWIKPWDFQATWEIKPDENDGYPVLTGESESTWLSDPSYYNTQDKWKGSGTEEDPYLISSAEDLAGLLYMVSSGELDYVVDEVLGFNCYYSGVYFKQTADIDLSAHDWVPIGGISTGMPSGFAGVYDGNGYTISGLNLMGGGSDSDMFQSLFGFLGGVNESAPAIVKNLTITDSLILSFGGFASSIAGYAVNAVIDNCTNYSDIIGNGYIGGIASYGMNVTITNCRNEGKLTGLGGFVGGILVLSDMNVTIENCYNMGDIQGTAEIVAGVYCMPGQEGNIRVVNCYNFGEINVSSSMIGGVVAGAMSTSSTSCYIDTCANFGNITSSAGNAIIGGVVGLIQVEGETSQFTLKNCYSKFTATLNEASFVGGIIGQSGGDYSSFTGLQIYNCASDVTIVAEEGMILGQGALYVEMDGVAVPFINSYGLINGELTMTDETNAMDGNFAYLENFNGGKPVPIGIYYILDYGITTGIVDQINSLT